MISDHMSPSFWAERGRGEASAEHRRVLARTLLRYAAAAVPFLLLASLIMAVRLHVWLPDHARDEIITRFFGA
jgi:hypothetical protein